MLGGEAGWEFGESWDAGALSGGGFCLLGEATWNIVFCLEREEGVFVSFLFFLYFAFVCFFFTYSCKIPSA